MASYLLERHELNVPFPPLGQPVALRWRRRPGYSAGHTNKGEAKRGESKELAHDERRE
jgi:hypothetical protein